MVVNYLKNLFFSINYLRAKKKGMVSDIYVPEWYATLSERDIGDYRIRFDLGNGHICSAMVIHVEEPGIRAKGVHLNLEFIDDEKYIVHCSLFEFIEKYLPTINYLMERNCVIESIVDKEEYLYGKKNY